MEHALSFPHRVTRLVFEAGQPYEKFLSRYEAAVPPADPRWLGGLAATGEQRPCTGYLMGHAIPDKLYRKDPAVMLYSPLRTLIYIDSRDRTRFAVDQPSTALSGFADQAITRLGVDLDRKLAELLDSLGVDASQIVRAAHPAGRRAEAV
jgi:hypothetical protein